MIIRESTGSRNERIKAGGSSLADTYADGYIELYSGTIPASADNIIDGTVLCPVTESGGAFVSGAAANGINLDAAVDGTVSKAAAETWTGDNTGSGVATYGVLYANTVDKTASTTAIRIVFDIGTSGAFLNLSTTTLAFGEPTTLTAFEFTQPE